MNTTPRRRALRRGTGIVAVIVALVTLMAACGSSSGADSGGASKASYAKTAYPASDPATLKEMSAKVLNSDADVNSLPPEIQQALMTASKPLTDAQRKIFNECLAKDDCQTGQGRYTLAIVDDQVNTFYSMSRAETVAMAIKSGAIKRILHFASDVDVQKYLADWRSAIGQGSDLILSIYGALGNQAGPVIEQAKAKGIPVVNGCCALAPDVAKKLTVNVDASICKMWNENGGGEKIAAYLKDKGDTNPTYALFTGPAGNAFAGRLAAVRQEGDGGSRGSSRSTTAPPSGRRKAPSRLPPRCGRRARSPTSSSTTPIAEDFIHAYEDAGDKDIPMFVLTASSTVGTAKAYKEAKAKGFNIDVWVAPAIVWLQDVGLQTEIEIADGKKASGDTITYPMTLTDLADVIDKIDLNVNDAVFIGNTLEPQDQNESLKH